MQIVFPSIHKRIIVFGPIRNRNFAAPGRVFSPNEEFSTYYKIAYGGA